MRVIVVGGGVIGCNTAYFLSLKPSCHVIVVEQCAIACAASGKAGGFLARDWCSGPLDPLARRSFDLHAYVDRTVQRGVWCLCRVVNMALPPVRSDLASKHGNPWEYRRLTTVSAKITGYESSMVERVPWLDGVDQGESFRGGGANNSSLLGA